MFGLTDPIRETNKIAAREYKNPAQENTKIFTSFTLIPDLNDASGFNPIE